MPGEGLEWWAQVTLQQISVGIYLRFKKKLLKEKLLIK